MNKNEQNRVVAWRLNLLRQASDLPRNVAQTCRHFGLSRQTFYNAQSSTEPELERTDIGRPRLDWHTGHPAMQESGPVCLGRPRRSSRRSVAVMPCIRRALR
jgi:hypothetical protein